MADASEDASGYCLGSSCPTQPRTYFCLHQILADIGRNAFVGAGLIAFQVIVHIITGGNHENWLIELQAKPVNCLEFIERPAGRLDDDGIEAQVFEVGHCQLQRVGKQELAPTVEKEIFPVVHSVVQVARTKNCVISHVSLITQEFAAADSYALVTN